MVYIKLKHYIYKLLLNDETKIRVFFKVVFNSYLFFKTFLIKEATAVIPEISESWKLQLPEKVKSLSMWERLGSEDNIFSNIKNAAAELHKDLLSLKGYKDNNNGDNFKLNHSLMAYIKIRHCVYEHVLSNENLLNQNAPTPSLDFFKKVFRKFLLQTVSH